MSRSTSQLVLAPAPGLTAFSAPLDRTAWRPKFRRVSPRFRMTPFLFAGVFAITPSLAQVSLTVNKSGNDVVLAWSGGSGTYDVVRSSAYRMSANTSILKAATTTSGLTDTGALVLDHNPPLYCYVIADVAAKPALNISSPCDTPPGGPLCTASTTGRFANVSGTTNSTTPVYLSDLQAVTTAGTFAANDVPLALGSNVVTAATRSANGDWAIDQNPDQPPGRESPADDHRHIACGCLDNLRRDAVHSN